MGNVWEQKLPTNVKVWDDRRKPIIEACRGKRVIHVGCCDDKRPEDGGAKACMHDNIAEVAKSVIGVDRNETLLDKMAAAGHKVAYSNLEYEDSAEYLFEGDEFGGYDLIVIPEVIEHLTNLNVLFGALADRELPAIITTPNAFSWRILKSLKKNVELVHPDHVHYFSVSTLTAVCREFGLQVDNIETYNYPIRTDDETEKMFQVSPFFAEGLVFYVSGKGIEG